MAGFAAQPDISALAREVSDMGAAIGLPLVAACADISSSRPALDENGTPIAALFEFSRPSGRYWQSRDLALHNAIVTMVRQIAEPFYYDNGLVGTWRPLPVDDTLLAVADRDPARITAAITVPVRLPRSGIGAVVWASNEAGATAADKFDAHARDLLPLAMRFILACDEASHGVHTITQIRLTRREIQCVKLVAAGKTDSEIGTILDLSIPTVRFHLGKASRKLESTGRLRTAQRAMELGYVTSHC